MEAVARLRLNALIVAPESSAENRHSHAESLMRATFNSDTLTLNQLFAASNPHARAMLRANAKQLKQSQQLEQERQKAPERDARVSRAVRAKGTWSTSFKSLPRAFLPAYGGSMCSRFSCRSSNSEQMVATSAPKFPTREDREATANASGGSSVTVATVSV